MEFNRTELMPGVFLSHLRSDKFKTACMSVTLLTQLRRETAAMNAVIPFVLRRGTTRYSDMEQLSRRMDELYGAAVEPVVRRIGEIQCIGFYGSFPEPDYLPGGEALLGDTCALMAQLLLGGVLLVPLLMRGRVLGVPLGQLRLMLGAALVPLGALALDLNSIKITFESFPILLGALLFGPLDGLAVGFVGTLLYQLLRYGVSATTLLWILPYALAGLVTGIYAKRRGFSLTTGQTVGIVVAAEVLVMALNTLVMYIDAKLYGYWFPGFISAMLLPRGAVCIVKAVVFGLVLPKLCARVRRALPGEGEKTHGA